MWAGFLFALGAMLSNMIFFARLPGQHAIPWLSLLLAVVALATCAVGIWRISRKPRIYRGNVLNSLLSVFSLLLAGLAIFSFIHARALPTSASAPQVGQKAPDFTLEDTNGQPVSLGQLFSASADNLHGLPPKAVLLIFYRGYW